MKRPSLLIGAVVLALGAAMAACMPEEKAKPVDTAIVKVDLQTVAKARVLFAHQSVGRNILEGVQALSKELDVPVRIQQIDKAPPDAEPGIFHAYIGINGDPNGKLEAFSRLVDGAPPKSYDTAVLKFCYEDLGHDARGREGLVERYSSRMGELQARHPELRVLPVTAPLRADPPGWKTTVKRWIGRDTEEDADNIVRNAYNEGVRARFAGGLFDVAAVESTLPDGRRSSFSANGKTIYTLASPYTTDGGHLNEEGRRRAAAAFLHAVAQGLQAAPH